MTGNYFFQKGFSINNFQKRIIDSPFCTTNLKQLCNCKIFKNTLEYLQKHLADTKELLIFASTNYKNK
ncbi:hypothetical protein DXA63_04695 [Segatella copri]|uniref:Uncharacterized protein n=1 Tax=Segatella copri TaxID=165179 RepID=A0AA92UP65_9BACT|nr:hypothetical protein DXA63_04695 [Segatella copri]